jgi:hypothetical protein
MLMSTDSFSGEPRTLWLTQLGDDRDMRLLEHFTFTDPSGELWDAPAGSVIDGASIPRALWTLVGSPYTGDYRRASIVHDVACDRAGTEMQKRRAADRMFYHACRAGGCSVEQATILYLGVRAGAIWPFVPQWAPAMAAEARGPRLVRSAAEDRLESDFRQAAEMMLAPGETDDIDEIERRADRALSTVAGLDASVL